MDAMLELKRRGAIVFEYGNNLRTRAELGGCRAAFEIQSFIELFIRPLFCEGIGPFRWIAISGEASDILAIDDMILDEFRDNHRICDWIRLARIHVKFQGLPARIGWLGHGERSRLAIKVNEAVAAGVLKGPVAFTRDHLDGGSAAMPFRETSNMRDGSDAIADWPILNALLNATAGADLIAIHGLADYGKSAGLTVVADGSESAAERLKNTLDCDTGLGILRHADAGYDNALAARERMHLGLHPASPR
jgi:urocanate hydratase